MSDNKTCPNHPDRPVKTKGLCASCYQKSWRSQNPEHLAKCKENERLRSKRRHKEQPEWYKAYNKKRWSDPEFRARSAKLRWKNHLKNSYNLSIEEYDQMLQRQNGVCAICEKFHKKLCVDHNHKTGKVRGLLCSPCNGLVGYLESRKHLVPKATEYIGYYARP